MEQQRLQQLNSPGSLQPCTKLQSTAGCHPSSYALLVSSYHLIVDSVVVINSFRAAAKGNVSHILLL